MIWPNPSIWPLVTIGHTIIIINLLVAFHGSIGYLVRLCFPGFLVISPKYETDDLFLKTIDVTKKTFYSDNIYCYIQHI